MAELPEGFSVVKAAPVPEGFRVVQPNPTDMKVGEMIRAYQEGRDLTPRQRELVEELNQRKNLGLQWGKTYRQQHMEELAQDQNWLQTLGIATGRGFHNVARGLGFGEESATEKEAYGALKKESPITTAVGEAVGEAAPFVPLGVGAGSLATLPARIAAGGVVSGLEGGILSEGNLLDKTKGAGVGAGIGMAAELLLPVVGRLGRKVLQRLGKTPKGALIDAAGQPTRELLGALDEAGMTFDDLTEDAVEFLSRQKAGAVPEQAARAARFAEEGIPATRGEVTQDFAQQATEQHLLGSMAQDAAEPLRAFKKRQSDRIAEVLTELGGQGFDKETTGELVQAALEGRKKLLRSTKNELYEEFANLSKEAGMEKIPLLVDQVPLPDARTLRRLDRVAKGSVSDGMEILAEHGIVPVPEGSDLVPDVLTIDNYDDVMQALQMIMRGDQTGATKVAFTPIIEAIENEADNLVETLAKRGDVPDDILAPLRKARQTVRTLKTEFAPQDIAERMIAQKKNGGEALLTEASQVYDKIVGAGSRVEDVRRLTRTLARSPDGAQALGALQSTVILDLMDTAFSAQSRKIAGETVFNPVAFINKLKKLNASGKIDAIFKNNPEILKRLKNVDKIARDLVPPERTVPKGSAGSAMFASIVDRLALNKIPGFNVILGVVRASGEPVKVAGEVRKALKGDLDTQDVRNTIEIVFPRLATALGIATMNGDEQ